MPHTSVLVATALLGVGVGPSSVRAAAAAGGPSAASGVVHMVFDDFRPDLPMYGQKFVHAPNLEAFANRSLVFDRAYVRSPHGPHPTRGATPTSNSAVVTAGPLALLNAVVR